MKAALVITTNNGDTMTGGRADFIDTEEYEDLKNTANEKLMGEYSNENTREFYTKRFRYWLAWCDDREDVDPRNPEKDDVKNYVRWMKSEDASSRKLEHRVRGIRGTYKVLVEENVVDTNPAENYFPSDFLDSTKRGNAQNERTIAENRHGPHANFDTITPEEFEELLENVEAPRFRNQLICKTMWQLKLRSEQITMIQIGNESDAGFPRHIDFEDNRVDLQDNKKDIEADDYWYKGYFKDDVKFMLKKWIEDKRRQLGPSMAESSDYLFITHQKEQMRPEHISRIIKTAAKNAGIQEKMYEDSEGRTRWKVTSHTLRRSAATYLANKTDYPLHMLASDLNHRSVETTRDRYVRENNEERKKRRQEISEL